MTNDDIRKLLGGYATNTLTEEERKALFEAALEDQELFDALQQDQPLKELLASPVTRAQVAQALDQSSTKPRAWWSHWWTWGGAAGALAAGVFVVVMIRSNAPQVNQQIASIETAPQPNPTATAEPVVPPPPQSTARRRDEDRAAAKPRSYTVDGAASGGRQAESKTEASAGKNTKEEDRLKDQPTTAGAPAPPPPPAVASSTPPVQQAQQAPATPSPSQEQVRNQVQAFRDQERAAAPQKSVAPAGAVSGFVSASNRAPSGLRYSLIKRDAAGAYVPVAPEALQAGDSVRISVTPAVQGYLTLSVLDASGDWKSVYPAPGQTLAVKPNSTYSVPDSNIEVQPKDQRFRLTLVPILDQSVNLEGQARTDNRNVDQVKKAKVAPESALRKQAPIIGQPLVLDVTISPKTR